MTEIEYALTKQRKEIEELHNQAQKVIASRLNTVYVVFKDTKDPDADFETAIRVLDNTESELRAYISGMLAVAQKAYVLGWTDRHNLLYNFITKKYNEIYAKLKELFQGDEE